MQRLVHALRHLAVSAIALAILMTGFLVVTVFGADAVLGTSLVRELAPPTALVEITPRVDASIPMEQLADLAVSQGIATNASLSFEGDQATLALSGITSSRQATGFVADAGFAVGMITLVRFNPVHTVQAVSGSARLLAILLACQFAAMTIVGFYRVRELGRFDADSQASTTHWKSLAVGILAGIAATVATTIVELVQERIGIPVEEQAWVEPALRSGGVMVAVFVLLVVLVAPFAEELFFRGYAFRFLRKHIGLAFAYPVSGVLFATAHWHISALVVYFVYGVILAYLLTRTGRLLTAVAAHSTINALGVASILLR